MFLKATLQKEIPNQSLPKAYSEAAVRSVLQNGFSSEISQYLLKNICWSLFLKHMKTHVSSREYCEIF